jgi:hypothetical protein
LAVKLREAALLAKIEAALVKFPPALRAEAMNPKVEQNASVRPAEAPRAIEPEQISVFRATGVWLFVR